MDSKKLADELNRLFYELITAPWQRPSPNWAERGGEGAECELEIPIGEATAEEVSVTAEGRRVLVSVRIKHASDTGSGMESVWRQRVDLPADAALEGVIARSEEGVLHIVIRMKRPELARGRER